MKSKRLLSLMLLCFAVFGMARADEVVIGDTEATTSQYTVPVNLYYNYSLTQQIYTADEIGMAGTINSIAFDYVYTSSFNMNNVQVYMMNVDKENFETTTDMVSLADAELVWEGTFTADAAGWVTLDLTTPFVYDGTSNLLVCCYDPTSGYPGSAYKFRTTATTDYLALAYYSDSSYPSLDDVTTFSGSKTRYQYRNNIMLDITPSGVVCQKPVGVSTGEVTPHTCELYIEYSGGAVSQNLRYKASTDADWTMVTGLDGMEGYYMLTELNPETTYTVGVQSVCEDGNTSGWSSTTFTTPIACPIPTNLTVTLTPGDGTVATLSWTETSTATTWQLFLTENGDPYNEYITIESNPYTLTGLEPEQLYTAQVRAYCDDIDQSEWSNIVSFTPTNTYSITVNDGTTTNNYVPVYGMWVDSYTKSQFIIPANTLADMAYGVINKMTFYSNTASKTWGTAQFDILLAEVNNTTFESATLVDWNTMDIVYSGSVSVSDYKMEIVFDNNYQYTGGNLLVGFHQTQTGTYSSISWYGISSTASAIGGYDNNAKALSVQDFLPKATFNYVPGEEPECPKPAALTVNYTGGTTAEVSWTSDASAWNLMINGISPTPTIIENVTNPYTLTDLEMAHTYNVSVQANCGEATSDWTSEVSFTTDLCLPEDMCEITFELTDSYGDGWNGAYIDVIDVLTGQSLAHMSNQNTSKATETETYTLAVCNGREIQFVWHGGSYDNECSFVIKDVEEEEIVSGTSSALPYTYTVDCTVNPCTKPTGLAISNITAHTAQANFTPGSDEQDIWVIAWTTDPEEDPNEAYEMYWIEEPEYIIGSGDQGEDPLEPSTTYYVYIAADCSGGFHKPGGSGFEPLYEGMSDWVGPVSFTTLEACPAPQDAAVEAGHYAANVFWTGYSDSYMVTLGWDGEPTNFLTVDFADGIPSDWDNGSDYPWEVVDGYIQTTNAGVSSSTSSISVSASYDASGTIEFDAECRGEGSGTFYDHCDFYIDDTRMLYAGANINGWNHYIFDVTPGQHTFTWSYTKDSSVNPTGDQFAIDNVVMNLSNFIWDEPIEVENTSYAFEGLEAGTDYYVRILGFCGQIPSAPTLVTFTTLSENYKIFAIEGDWDVAENWIPAGAPTIEQDVELQANATITGYATANNIIQGNYAITIEDGGRLMHNYAGNNVALYATVKKNIAGYGTSENGSYYLIANPLDVTVNPDAETNFLLSGNYDFYYWSASNNAENDSLLEWVNYKAHSFTMGSNNYNGYLYANEEDMNLNFTGSVRASNNNVSRYVYADDEAYRFGNWNLLGNPFVCDAYLVDFDGNALPFYRMNGNGDELTAVEMGAIAPVEGVFCVPETAQYVYFTRTAPANRSSMLNITATQGRSTIDNAIVRFGEGSTLEKISFHEGSTKVYMPVEGKDYAVANAGNVGEMPVAFKAENNGSYTLNFNSENVSFNYLHLIDNMTGVDTDLLSTPYYTFNAQTTDYANRFKLVFATGNNNEDNFAFFSNGSFVISNEGEATLQVVDVTGRILMNETIIGSTNVNVDAAPGVYMLRLVNGNNVKVQKVVVK